MANLSEDIQCASSDTRPPMLDRTDFASWQQRIRLYCRGKENGVNILKSIDEGPFQMGTVREPLAEGTEGAPHLGPERPRVYSDLSPEEKDRYNSDIRAINILLQGLPKDIYTLINHHTNAKNIRDNVKMLLEGLELTKEDQESQLCQGTNPWGGGAAGFGGVQNRVGNANPGQARQVKCYNCKDIGHIARNCTQPKHSQNSDYYKDKMLLMQAQENGVSLDEEQLLFLAGGQDTAIDEDVDEQPVQDLALNVDNVFQADDYDAFDFDVDEAPMAQTMFMANLSSANLVNDKAGPSDDSVILSEVHDHDHYQDIVCAHHEEHAMRDNVQLNHVVDSHADYTSDSNMISYDQYVKENVVPVIHSNVSSVPNDAHMMIYNDMSEPHAQSVSTTSPNTVVENSLTAELSTYKEQVELYERRARPKPYYNELNKVAIGYKNPLCLTRVKLQPALYNGHDIIKYNHVSSIVRNTEDTLEIAEITTRKMNDKMKDPKCVTHKALTIEIKEMKDVSEELEAEVAQCGIDRILDEIERKNLLIANENLIVECLSKEVFSVATNSELNVARFTKMHVAHTIVETRSPELKAELSNLRDKSHNDNYEELVKRFSNLEVHHLNLQLKYQNLKDSFGNNPPTPNKDTPDFDSVFVIVLTTANVNLKAQILNTVNSVSKDPIKPKVLALGKYVINVDPIFSRLRNNREAHLDYLRHLKNSVETIRDIVKEAKVNMRLTLVRKTLTNEIKNMLLLLQLGKRVNRCTDASGSQPRSNTKKNKISPAKGVNKLQVEEQPRTNKSPLRTSNHVDSSSRPKHTVVQIVLLYLDSGCSKHIMGDRSRLMNFMKKFIWTVRFRNDHFGAIMGYGDYVIGDSVIFRVYCVKGLGHNLFFVGQFCDADLDVAFRKHSCYVRDTDGVELIKGSRGSNLTLSRLKT
nr:integrase, catalytic region, zinc finger, CCHC-type, peptidase aspartic, catalytic [Tanacetum cinerariifolium]